MNEVDARHPPPLPHPSLIPVGKGSASFFGQRVAVCMTLVTLHVHFPMVTFSMHSQNEDFDLLTYTIIQFHANSCMYVHTCVCMLS